MIVGIGIDVVDIARFETSLTRTPGLRERLFCPDEAVLAPASLAARFAAKEALAKALGAPGDLAWHDAEVRRAAGGAPYLELRGTVAARAGSLGVTRSHLTLSHDGGVAIAWVLLEADGKGAEV